MRLLLVDVYIDLGKILAKPNRSVKMEDNGRWEIGLLPSNQFAGIPQVSKQNSNWCLGTAAGTSAKIDLQENDSFGFSMVTIVVDMFQRIVTFTLTSTVKGGLSKRDLKLINSKDSLRLSKRKEQVVLDFDPLMIPDEIEALFLGVTLWRGGAANLVKAESETR